MSRSGYSDDCDNLGLWRGAVERAIKGKRGQTLLRAMADALDAMPVKRLIPSALVRADGECCALGAVALAKQIDTKKVDETDREWVGRLFGIAPAMAAEIAYENDEAAPRGRYDDDRGWVPFGPETPEQRWARMRAWVAKQIKETP